MQLQVMRLLRNLGEEQILMHKESQEILTHLQKVIHGKEQVLQSVWLVLLAEGHILLEDLPGVGKTTLAKAFSQVISLDEQRVQLTPDTVSSDITGFMIYNQQKGEFVLKKGVVMTNILLADELNRTSSRTQAALLEAMQERQVTVDEFTYELPRPFHVIATQNPSGTVGTHSLPLAQLDRFMVRLSMGYPSKEAQIAMLKNHQHGQAITIEPLATKEQFLSWQQSVRNIHIADELLAYVTRLTEATRHHTELQYGVSPRGALALCQYVRARAFLYNRTFAIPEDIIESFVPVCSHRVISIGQRDSKAILQEILEQVPSPDEALLKK